ncbi:hypothetical protein B0H15DRAFT_902139 [Mycena belliarum]|uniref:SGNH hydrolase-type esterase domain-containing protein n=1 Tax=Mycena belliarum TaxID=1033014 RepID=A0AAD6XTB6_9AGAR|nr:hypothetical protein B0H15DRAFT_902139 [Mycena belliae]
MAASAQDVIILFGDSITQAGWTEGGFGAHLASAFYDYARKLDVLNRGLAGYNTDWAVPVLKQGTTHITQRYLISISVS